MDEIDHHRRQFLFGSGTAGQAIAEQHISSLVVHARPEHAATVVKALLSMPGAEIPVQDPNGKLIVTLETTTDSEIVDRINNIHAIPGVLSATLVFHHVESDDQRG